MDGSGTGVTSLVSVNGIASASVIAAAAEIVARQSSSTAPHSAG
jgi:F0F1-type ATP synthase membrane subunit c/vacuolar-type H+-ATPase subunit K